MNNTSERKLIPLTQWNDYHPWPTQAGLRYLTFNADQNNFKSVIRRSGRRILLDEQAFFQWIDEQNEGSVA